jgi:glycosyltransferase involved in cell wall biosynthesis
VAADPAPGVSSADLTYPETSVEPSSGRPSLSIVIPAYNEAEGIAAIIERTLAVRHSLRERARLSGVDVIVVDDGSSDRTAAIAAGYPEIDLVTFPENQGYGAAIKTGFARATGELVGFLDADGTCDPAFFADLCIAIEAEGADVAVGSRLGRTSDMPALRRFGNRIFAGIIKLWSGAPVTDSASGMRVLRRSALPRLYPLPDGMDFTPAMSSLAIFDPHLKLVELPMPYAERTGTSKLRVVGDGLRFLRIIVDTALTYRPLRFLGLAGAVVLLLGVGYGIRPVVYYLGAGHLEDDMIYRLVAVAVALTVGVNLLAVGVIGQQTVAVIHEDFQPARGARRGLNRLLLDFLIPWGILAVVAGVALNWRSLVEYAGTGRITAHWIYVLTGGLLVTLGAEFITFGVLARVVNILRARKAFRRP